MASARQRAAAKRNIVKAQLASARARRGKKRSDKSQHTYGTGRKGRKGTRRALYGSRKHGISPTQYQRRRQRSAKWKHRGSIAVGTVTTAVGIYASMTPGHKVEAKQKFGSGLNNVKQTYKFARLAATTKRGMRKRK